MTAVPLHRWHPIQDLPKDYGRLASEELRSLADVWKDQQSALAATEGLQLFNERLERRWAIETGIIERIYSLDRGVTHLLIEQGIDASLIPHGATDKDPKLVAQIIRDHKNAVEGLFSFVRGERPLTTSYIKELHAQLTRHQETSSAVDQFGQQIEVPLTRGAYKRLPNNPERGEGATFEYCPPEQVPGEMEALIRLHEEHGKAGVPPEVEAAWLHHRFSQIHPFQDGNGRVVRALASLVFIKAGWFPLVVTRDDRLAYINALEAADAGDLKGLVHLFTALEKRSFVGALSEAGAVLQRGRVDDVIGAARDVFGRRQQALQAEWEHSKDLAATLQADADRRFAEIAAKLAREIGTYNRSYRFRSDAEPFEGARDHYFRWQIVQTAKKLGYFANTAPFYRAWSRLILTTDAQAEVLVAFHGIGHDFRGIMAASMCFFRREETEDGEREVGEVVVLPTEVFQVNYRETESTVRDRFSEWLEEGLVKGLEIWRIGL